MLRAGLLAPRVLIRATGRGSLHRALSSVSKPPSASSSATAALATTSSSVLSRQVKNWAALSKPSLTALVVVTSAFGAQLAGAGLSVPFAGAVVGTTLLAASANTCNQIYERKSDMLMKRTRGRPLPRGKMTVAEAAQFAVATGVIGTGTLLATTNPLTAALGLSTLGLYAGVYTPMKKMHPMNTAVGAVVGAIPPVMGWTAVTNSLMSIEPAVLFSTLLLWQIPHFMAIAWRHQKCYSAGGHKMLPAIDPTGKMTAAVSLACMAGIGAIPFASFAGGMTTSCWMLLGSLISAPMAHQTWRFYQHPTVANSRNLFFSSLYFVPAFLGGMLLMTYGDHGTAAEKRRCYFTIMKDWLADKTGVKDIVLKQ